MEDEEYFRNMLIASEDVYETMSGKKLWDSKVLRGLTRTHGIKRKTFEKLKTVELKTEAGLFLGMQKAFLIDKEKFDKVLGKIVRGLHFLHTGFIAANNSVIVKWDISRKSLVDLIENHKYIQFSNNFGDIVGYQGAKTVDTGASSMWWIHFFKKHICIAFVLEEMYINKK